jgi:hypothetical protein
MSKQRSVYNSCASWLQLGWLTLASSSSSILPSPTIINAEKSNNPFGKQAKQVPLFDASDQIWKNPLKM